VNSGLHGSSMFVVSVADLPCRDGTEVCVLDPETSAHSQVARELPVSSPANGKSKALAARAIRLDSIES
jgi:hypothetical protein